MEKITKYIKNESKDGLLPMCPYCGVEYSDTCYGEVKNYPDDGVLAVFMQCKNCDKTARVLFEWTNRVK